MKKISILLVIIIFAGVVPVFSQATAEIPKIDLMLVRGEYKKVIDTCQLILSTDSLNAEIYYKMGLAYQNFLPDDKSFNCFLQAATIDSANTKYCYMLAKAWYGKGKMKQAKQLFLNLSARDSMNWSYAYYLTSILMQDKDYDESLKIYKQFYDRDTTDYVILDKIGFALLRKGFFPTAIEYYNKSLAQNKNNVGAIKNLSYLYASTLRADTALQLLTMGMKVDSTDLDLYIRRAALNYTLNYTKRALDDYLKILATGDSTTLYLKRAGIGYSNNLQYKQGIKFLLLAYNKDSTDIEVSTFLARNYERTKDLNKSAYYYRHIISTLDPYIVQTSINYILLAEILKNDSKYNDAIKAYLDGQQIRPRININMIIANIYDEKLDDIPKALRYYQLFLDNIKNSDMKYPPAYTESVRKRIEFLKNKSQTSK